MAINGGIVAALAGVAGLGLLAWKKRQASPASSSSSLCKTACVAAAKQSAGPALTAVKAAEIEKTCTMSCGLLSQYGATGARALGSFSRWLLTGGSGGEAIAVNAADCPQGSKMAISWRPVDNRDPSKGGRMGPVCLDEKTGAVVGYFESDGFRAVFGAGASFESPKPVVPITSPTTPTGGGSMWSPIRTATPTTQTAGGGTTVTVREEQPRTTYQTGMQGIRDLLR